MLTKNAIKELSKHGDVRKTRESFWATINDHHIEVMTYGSGEVRLIKVVNINSHHLQRLGVRDPVVIWMHDLKSAIGCCV